MTRGRSKSATTRWLGLAAATLIAVMPSNAQDLQRGARNYQALMDSRIKLQDLSPAEQHEVLDAIRAKEVTGNGSQECERARSSTRNAADDEMTYVQRLTQCIEGSRQTDRCGTEFERVRSAHHGYELAVSTRERVCR